MLPRMRAYHVTAPGALELRDVEVPHPGPRDIVLEIRAALTCGTDLKLIRRGHPIFPFPSRLGHEYAGRVVEAGEGARFAVGSDVMTVPTAPCGACARCRAGAQNLCQEALASYTLGGFAERLLLPARVAEVNAFQKPPHLPWEHAAFLEPLACVVHGLDRIGVERGDTVVVVGAGPIGLLHLLLARVRGASKVIVLGRRPPRLEAARQLGADLVIDERAGTAGDVLAQVRDATGGLGADVVVECAATPEAWEQAVALARPGGRVLWFGGCKPGTTVTLDTHRVHYEEITVMGVFHFTPRDVREARRLLVDGELDPGPLVTGTLPLSELPDALDRVGRGEGVKYAVIP